MDTWRTAIVDAGPDHIRVRGHDVLDLMQQATFTDLIFLLHHQRLPSAGERRLLDAILIGGADHGAGAPSCAAARLAASGNRQSPSAAIAAGILTIGDEHGGAGSGCMEMIAAGLGRARAGRPFARRGRGANGRRSEAGEGAAARIRASRALDDRSARRRAVRPGAGRRPRRRRHPLRARARSGDRASGSSRSR